MKSESVEVSQNLFEWTKAEEREHEERKLTSDDKMEFRVIKMMSDCPRDLFNKKRTLWHRRCTRQPTMMHTVTTIRPLSWAFWTAVRLALCCLCVRASLPIIKLSGRMTTMDARGFVDLEGVQSKVNKQLTLTRDSCCGNSSSHRNLSE